MSVDTDTDSGTGESGLTTRAKDALGEWQLWFATLAAVGIAGYAAVFERNMPNGYVPFFLVFGALIAVYAFHDMRTTRDVV